ncbi:hypothetical protein FHX46_001812 [Amycolatopsis viridis]|uniref:Uncharacterized protein n=1 Tax=Amycolatopsis viridis TaxID=185678 RepID=A0ABX0STN6_9PSEU|nr:hypothetical protein [Amycolatopsis viridis]
MSRSPTSVVPVGRVRAGRASLSRLVMLKLPVVPGQRCQCPWQAGCTQPAGPIPRRVVLLAAGACAARGLARSPSSPVACHRQPHLLINTKTAVRLTQVSHSWINTTLGLSLQAVREDRILDEASAAQGDVRRLCDLFGISVKAAERYAHAVGHPMLTGTSPTNDTLSMRQERSGTGRSGGRPRAGKPAWHPCTMLLVCRFTGPEPEVVRRARRARSEHQRTRLSTGRGPSSRCHIPSLRTTGH